MARNEKCLTCKYCVALRTDKTAMKDIKGNFICAYLSMTGKRGNKGYDKNTCLLHEKKNI